MEPSEGGADPLNLAKPVFLPEYSPHGVSEFSNTLMVRDGKELVGARAGDYARKRAPIFFPNRKPAPTIATVKNAIAHTPSADAINGPLPSEPNKE